MLVGRDTQTERLRALVSEARGGATRMLVLRGDPGIGKTCLLDDAAAQADGLLVVRVRGHEAEQELPFAALSMLVAPLAEDMAELTAAQTAALEGALNLGPAVHGERAAVVGAVLALLAAAAERAPLLLAVDDVHLLDAPTRDALLSALWRIEHEPLAAVLTARSAPDVGPELEARLESFPRLELLGLDLAAARELTTARGHLSEAEWTAAAGNPLALLELTAPSGTGLPFDEPLPLSARLQRAYHGRLRGLAEDVGGALLLVATAGRADVLDGVLDDALAGRGLARATLEPAEEAGLVVLDAGAVAFTHPLVRSAVYRSAAPGTRRAAHRALAEAYSGRTAHGATERRAFHLAAATLGPDDGVAAELADVAERADKRHSVTTAAALFERAARLSLPGTARTGRIIRAALAGQAAGTLDASGPLLEIALAESDDEDLRTTATYLQCRLQMWSGHPAQARDQLLDLAERTETRYPVWSAAMRGHAAVVSIALGEQWMALGMAQRAVEVCAGLPDEHVLPILVSQAVTRAINGDTDTARAVLARAAPHLPGADPFSIDQVLVQAALAYACVEELDEARRWLDAAVAKARAAGATGLLPFQLSWLALVCWFTGDWNAARAHAVSAVQAAEQTGWRTELPNCLIALATVEAGLGHHDVAREHAARAERLGTDQSSTRVFSAHAARVRGLCELGAGRHHEAAALLAEAGGYARSGRIGDHLLFSWAGNLAEALVRAGRPDEALAAYRTAAEEAERTGRPTAHAVAARCAGLLATGEAQGREHFERAYGWHARAGQDFEHARTELCYGEFLRRHHRRDEAREHLGRARGTFARLGATPWLERTQAELTAAGDTSPRPASGTLAELTEQELQVAILVSEGITNREVAARLYLSPKTIEFHLSNVYRKLGVKGRSELIRLIAIDR